MKQAQPLFVLALAALVGCSFYARSPEDYRQATRDLLEQKNETIKDCYIRELKTSDTAQGKVQVRFEVEAKTGTLVKIQVVDDKSTASAGLQKCVVDALEGLKLDPADQRQGEATFEWDFAPAKR